MEDKRATISFCLFLLFLNLTYRCDEAAAATVVQLRTYVIHVQFPDNNDFHLPRRRHEWYTSLLPDSAPPSRVIYSYGDAIRGFAARLTIDEVKAMERREGFVSVHPDILLPLHTTYTPEFLGLRRSPRVGTTTSGSTSPTTSGHGIVIGVLDTGITPDHPSFRGDDMPDPPPSSWKGECNLPPGLCNNKLIGFKTFLASARLCQTTNATTTSSSFDESGHGSHTSSTAAGATVDNANMLGNANGTAVGMAPGAHVAMYQVCMTYGCRTADVLAGLSAAIDDGVDILSISLGLAALPYHMDVITVGTFRAMQRGILACCSAGNAGPTPSTLSNEAPWVLTVAASTTDRRIKSKVRLGDGRELQGETSYQPRSTFFPPRALPLVRPSSPRRVYCDDGSLDDTDVEGKIVVCDTGGMYGTTRVHKGDVVKKAGGAAMILVNQMEGGYTTLPDNHSLPASHLSYADGAKIKAYVASARNPLATIMFQGTTFGAPWSPQMAFFSSRGPSKVSLGILKPDVTGPGVGIIAAWRRVEDHRVETNKTRTPANHYSFNIASGTSMSAPHLSGIAASVRSIHPDWSPAAIKSAITTTSRAVDHEGEHIRDEQLRPASVFAMGSGHVEPTEAVEPGLVYDMEPKDYVEFLCRLGYKKREITTIVGHEMKCGEKEEEHVAAIKDLNYPSISVVMDAEDEVTVTRTVTNVGTAVSIYRVKVAEPAGVSVTVEPGILVFTELVEKKTFKVRLGKKKTKEGGTPSYAQGRLTWASDKHSVGSPISIRFV